MAAIVWSEKHSVNVKELDGQHKKMAAIINKFDDAVEKRKEETILSETLDDLLFYTETHFAREEELMRQYNYPEYYLHKEEHNSLTQEVVDLYKKSAKGDKDTAAKTAFLLGNWWLGHIVMKDKKHAKHLNSKGVT